MTSKKRLIIKAFSEMNVSKLEELLDDDKRYHLGLNKKLFIDKMSDVFEKFKKENDTVLKVHKGKCNGGNCFLKGKCTGFTFVGNVSKNGINLNFEDGKYTYNCIQRCYNFEIMNKRIKPISNFTIEEYDDLRI
jgi:hypothetical protein